MLVRSFYGHAPTDHTSSILHGPETMAEFMRAGDAEAVALVEGIVMERHTTVASKDSRRGMTKGEGA